MLRTIPKAQLMLALAAIALTLALPAFLAAQDDPSDTPLGDLARSLRKKTPPSQDVIDNDNLSQVMDEVQSRRASSSTLRYSMDAATAGNSFHVSAPDVTCSLSFSANAKALLSTQYAQFDLPPTELAKLEGPATIDGDSLQVSVFNGTDWHVSEVAVALTIVKRTHTAPPDAASFYGSAKLIPAVAGNSPQPPENGPESDPQTGPQTGPQDGQENGKDNHSAKPSDLTLLYRIRAAAPPSEVTVFRAPLNLDITPDEEWHWAIVQAKGYPPQPAPQTSQPSAPAATSSSEEVH